jgi:cytochrome c-type biogenesis protein CcmH/NrfG
MTKAQICIAHEDYEDATEALDLLLVSHPQDQKAWIMRGHAFYLLKNLFDSEESYINALRIKG